MRFRSDDLDISFTELDIPYVLRDDNLDVVMHIIGKMERSAVAVVDNSVNKKIIGYVTRILIKSRWEWTADPQYSQLQTLC